jgi:hemerythrin-like domain-containing protein
MRKKESGPMRDRTKASIRAHLTADHREIERTMECLIEAFAAGDEPEIERLWTLFESRLSAHIDLEDRYLLPALQRRSPRAARTIGQEHRHIRARIAELGLGVDLRTVRLETARAFIEELRAHARSEDRLLYAWADEHLDAEVHAKVLAAVAPAAGDGDASPPASGRARAAS